MARPTIITGTTDRAWGHPFIVPTIANFTGNYRALFAGFYTILHYNMQNPTKTARLAKPEFPLANSVLLKHLLIMY